jgi:peptidoglycan/LPS O-acetylase OafA/YrhL
LYRSPLDSFRRITTSGHYLAEIDGLRCIAIVAVLALHSYGAVLASQGLGAQAMEHAHGWLRLLGHSGYGVEVFFAISGLVLALPFAKQHIKHERRVRLTTYFLRRLTRLEPPYIVWLLIRSALLLATATLPMRFLLVHLAASVFYLHNAVFAIASRIEAVSWTLEIEVQFYLLAPWLTSVYRITSARIRRGVLLTLIAGATPIQWLILPGWHSAQNAGAWNLSLAAAIQFFLAGLLVADLYVDGWEAIPVSPLWDLVSMALWPLMFWLQPHAFRFLGPVLMPILFVAAFKGMALPAVLRSPVVSIAGGMCYSIYLTHRTTILILESVLSRFHTRLATSIPGFLLLSIPASIVAGAVYFRLVERPCMDPNWPRELMARFRSGPPGAPPVKAAGNHPEIAA